MIPRIIVLPIILLSFACSNINTSYAKKTNIKNYILEQKKNTTLYKDYRRVLIMDVLYFDWTLREDFVENYNNNYFVDNDELLTQHQREYQKEYQFFVLIALQDTPSKLDKTDAYWKFFFKDWDTKHYSPLRVEKIKKQNLYYQFIANNYAGLDNWTDLYLLKANRDFATSKTQNLVLQISSLEGAAKVKWENPSIFFDLLK